MTTRQPGRKPTDTQRRLVHSLPGSKQNGLRAARQIAQSRQFIFTERPEPRCVSCLGPRDRRSHPVCGLCATRRLAGLR